MGKTISLDTGKGVIVTKEKEEACKAVTDIQR